MDVDQRMLIAPTCAVISSVARGLTNYGDGILFHICAASLRAISGVPSADESAELQFAVLCTGIMSLTSMPLAIWLARSQLRRMAPYGLAMAFSGVAMLPAGTAALFSGNTRILEAFVGVFFIAFACVGLTNAVARQSVVIDENVASGNGEPEVPATGTGGDVVDRDLHVLMPVSSSPFVRFTAWANATLPPVSSSAYTPVQSLSVFFTTGVAAGFLGALMGTGGPPQMAAFAILETPKDEVRGIATIYALIDLPFRLSLWVNSAGSTVWAPTRDGPIYAAVSIASVIGFSVGAVLRARADTVAVTNAMFVLIALGATVLLGAARSTIAAVVCASGAIAFTVFLVFVKMHPERFNVLMTRFCRWRKKQENTAAAAVVRRRTETPVAIVVISQPQISNHAVEEEVEAMFEEAVPDASISSSEVGIKT